MGRDSRSRCSGDIGFHEITSFGGGPTISWTWVSFHPPRVFSQKIAPAFYSSISRPSIDPELMMRMREAESLANK